MVVRLVFLYAAQCKELNTGHKTGILKSWIFFNFFFAFLLSFTVYILVCFLLQPLCLVVHHNGIKTLMWERHDLWHGIGIENSQSAKEPSTTIDFHFSILSSQYAFSGFTTPSCKWHKVERLQGKSYKFRYLVWGTTCNLISHVYVFFITRPLAHQKNK